MEVAQTGVKRDIGNGPLNEISAESPEKCLRAQLDSDIETHGHQVGSYVSGVAPQPCLGATVTDDVPFEGHEVEAELQEALEAEKENGTLSRATGQEQDLNSVNIDKDKASHDPTTANAAAYVKDPPILRVLVVVDREHQPIHELKYEQGCGALVDLLSNPEGLYDEVRFLWAPDLTELREALASFRPALVYFLSPADPGDPSGRLRALSIPKCQ
eukprot:CAMPEP_0177587254 /NCGR_PEP_ID=MMETSP0419_2-20121207/5535_1 /TAXON_ID=582737 /ORGANISM="Tetraselmis sp., Strain GSL018" /LENGTH=214 /DNA_ID=CAMNT_0019077255 /DNA_START=26 /DNA_END=667 /DNA_ORIENTATION=+